MTIVFLSLLTFCATAQTLSEKDEKVIRETMAAYLDFTKENDFSGMMDYIYPKLFTLASKEQMIEVFSSLETMGIEMKFDKLHINQLEALHSDKEREYAFGNYDIQIRMILKNEDLHNELTVALMKDELKKESGIESLIYNDSTHTFSLEGRRYIMAIKDPDYGTN